MNSWFKIYRGLLESDLWLDDKFTHGQAWIDMIGNANYKDGTITVRGNVVQIKRGQLAWSIRYMMKRWTRTQDWVENFLKQLETTTQITTQKSNIISLINIVNYEKYQGDYEETTTQITTQNLTQSTTILKKDKKEKNTYMSGKEDFESFISLFNSLFKKKYETTDKRYEVFKLRVKKNTLDKIMEATKNLAKNPWNHGENDRNWVADPDYLLRSDEMIDRWFNYQLPKGKEMSYEAGSWE